MLECYSANEAYGDLLHYISQHGQEYTIRGKKCIEVTGLSYRICNPRKRIITEANRKFPLKGAFAEFMWYMTGNNEVKAITPYLKMWEHFSDNGETVNSNYGYQWRRPHDQILDIIAKIKNDKYTRQAVVCMYDKYFSRYTGKDNICTPTFQFFVRDDALNLIVNSRSRDLIRGECIDQFTFTLLQELVANSLGIDTGIYQNNIGSLHVYEEHFDLLTKNCVIPSEYEFPTHTEVTYENFWPTVLSAPDANPADENTYDFILNVIKNKFTAVDIDHFSKYLYA